MDIKHAEIHHDGTTLVAKVWDIEKPCIDKNDSYNEIKNWWLEGKIFEIHTDYHEEFKKLAKIKIGRGYHTFEYCIKRYYLDVPAEGIEIKKRCSISHEADEKIYSDCELKEYAVIKK